MQNKAKLLRQLPMVLILRVFWLNGIYADQQSSLPNGLIIPATVNLRNLPQITAAATTTVPGRQTVTITEESKLWYKVRFSNGLNGWIFKTYIATTTERVAMPEHSPEKLVNFAKRYLNAGYVYGGATPNGFDCSGFTRFVYTKFGFHMPHRSQDQMNLGIPVARGNLVPADLVFFSTAKNKHVNHVGIYIGENKFIHAASGSRRVRIDTLDETYYKNRYQGARRVLLHLNSLSLISRL